MTEITLCPSCGDAIGAEEQTDQCCQSCGGHWDENGKIIADTVI